MSKIYNYKRSYAKSGTPVFDVNLGTVGFLCSIEPEKMMEALDLVLQGKFKV